MRQPTIAKIKSNPDRNKRRIYNAPLTFREKIIIKNLQKQNWTGKKIHRVVPFASLRTIYNVMESATLPCKTKEKRGRKRKTSGDEDLKILQICEDTQGTLQEICRNVEKQLHITLSQKTIGNRLKEIGVKNKNLKPVPALTPAHIEKRKEFCQTYKRINWKRIIFSDETSIQLSPSRQRAWVFPWKRGVLPVIKYPKKKMFWSFITNKDVGPLVPIIGSLNSQSYIELLKKYLTPVVKDSMKKRHFIFQQDNAPCHSSIATRTWLAKNNIKVMKWPPNSPDLNPIENMWSVLKQRVMMEHPKTIDALTRVAKKEWNLMSSQYLNSLYLWMSKRVNQVLKRNGEKCDY